MNELKFNSAICTSVEQSKRLLELGLKPETADMVYQAIGVTPFKKWKEHKIEENFFPAWSLHRLIEMCNKTQFWMIISIYNNEITVDGALFDVFDNTYDNLISAIECLIKEGYFNKEYLKQ
jgi:hypothetical protein